MNVLIESQHVAKSAKIWHFSHVREGAVIGDNTSVGMGSYIGPNVIIGQNCKIQNGVMVYDPAVVEEGVFLGPGVILTNDHLPRAVIDPEESTRKVFEEGQRITVGKGASIGAGSVIIAPCQIGAWSMVGAGSVVTSNVHPHALVYGNPARPRGWICFCGKNLTKAPDGLRCPDDGRLFTQTEEALIPK